MTPTTNQSAGRRTITAFFDSQTDANEAIERLVKAGIARSGVNFVQGAGTERGASVNRDDEGLGFWEALKDMFLPDEDRATYAEGLRRGGFIVTVQTDSAHYEQAIDILDDEGTVNLDERAEAWRKEGWSESRITGKTSTVGSAAAASGVAARAAPGPVAGRAPQAAGDRDEVIALTEEHMRIGKREVSHGRVKVRSYVVETPVQEQVSLRKEHVSVERRPVDRLVTGNDKLFQDRTIEAEEKSEEAVVSKEARVKEELVVKKNVEQRTETVSDKVRRTEVEIEDERGNAIRSDQRKPR